MHMKGPLMHMNHHVLGLLGLSDFYADICM